MTPERSVVDLFARIRAAAEAARERMTSGQRFQADINRDMLLYGHARRGRYCMVQPAEGPVRFYETADCPNCQHYRAGQ